MDSYDYSKTDKEMFDKLDDENEKKRQEFLGKLEAAKKELAVKISARPASLVSEIRALEKTIEVCKKTIRYYGG